MFLIFTVTQHCCGWIAFDKWSLRKSTNQSGSWLTILHFIKRRRFHKRHRASPVCQSIEACTAVLFIDPQLSTPMKPIQTMAFLSICSQHTGSSWPFPTSVYKSNNIPQDLSTNRRDIPRNVNNNELRKYPAQTRVIIQMCQDTQFWSLPVVKRGGGVTFE